ncbi:hypothetical protein [Pararhizobium mangrovi]|uniref:hypothetical protein n=1 Tax=Pararhizobium mangrovi TaxID=2590452 RepID=UPI0015E8730F|nr:hypothetical protein [Pararhizobium mangrovi]
MIDERFGAGRARSHSSCIPTQTKRRIGLFARTAILRTGNRHETPFEENAACADDRNQEQEPITDCDRSISKRRQCAKQTVAVAIASGILPALKHFIPVGSAGDVASA